MERIEAFLNENRWRLVDLFADLDKNKDWRVKKDDFVRECKKGRLDVDDAMIEELIMCLGTSKSNKIKYKALAKGRKSHLSDKRSQLRGSFFLLNLNLSLNQNIYGQIIDIIANICINIYQYIFLIEFYFMVKRFIFRIYLILKSLSFRNILCNF